MDRKNYIRRLVRLPACRLAGLTICVLFTFLLTLHSPPSLSFAADKLVVKDSEGNIKFVVTDTGSVGMGVETVNPVGRVEINDPSRHLCLTGSTVRAGIRSDTPIGILTLDGYAQTFKAGALAIASSYLTAIPPTNGIYVQGQVGIGTMTPQGKLDVNGSIYQRGGQLHADYVFNEDYRLESIEEHAQYMWENMHLKALPPIKKDENGQEIVEIGTYQKGILEELEKAHIYIEQLNEKIKTLESKIQALE